MAWWLVKQEPATYSFEQFQKEKTTEWTGVRNYQARNFLKAMQPSDRVFFYHSGEQKAIVGLAIVAKAAFPDPTADKPNKEGWVAVELKTEQALGAPISLAQIKTEKKLKDLLLIKQSRLSVMPVSEIQAKALLALAKD